MSDAFDKPTSEDTRSFARAALTNQLAPARASVVNRTHRVVRERAKTMAAHQSMIPQALRDRPWDMTRSVSGSSPIVTAPFWPEDADMEPQSATTARLVRRSHGRMIAGVCQGIAEHFDVDPILVRIAFVVTSFFGGAGFVAYVAAWLLIPDEDERMLIYKRIAHMADPAQVQALHDELKKSG